MFKRLTLLATLLLPAISHAESGIFKFTTGVDYSSGKYGQKDSTEITCIPFTGTYSNDKLTLKLTVPWIQIVGNGAVKGSDSLVVNHAAYSSNRTTESGLGDIVTSVSYTFFQSAEYKLILDTTAKVKFGTGSYDRGLSTGENDYTIQEDLYKTIDKTTLLATLGYKKLGDPEYINLNNVWFGSLGFSYKFDANNNAGAFVDLRQATSSYGTSLREYTIYYSHKFNQNYKLQSYLSHGDTRSSADWGGGLLLAYTW